MTSPNKMAAALPPSSLISLSENGNMSSLLTYSGKNNKNLVGGGGMVPRQALGDTIVDTYAY